MKRLTKAQRERIDDFAASTCEAAEYLADIADEAETYQSERSEAWADSGAGQQFNGWVETLREAADRASEANDAMQAIMDSPDEA